MSSTRRGGSEREKMDIDKLEAGKELDGLIASRIFGWIYNAPGIKGIGWSTPQGKMYGQCPRYSVDISAAWEVVEKISGTLGQNRSSIMDAHWNDAHGNFHFEFWGERKIYNGQGETLPLAICRAALKAVQCNG